MGCGKTYMLMSTTLTTSTVNMTLADCLPIDTKE